MSTPIRARPRSRSPTFAWHHREETGPSPCPIIRLDTNQGVYGLGEVRDGASATYALFLKSRLLNENPLNITYLFQKIKQFGFHGGRPAAW
jgi:L-alanine-DL-glutamate epimerase-like enolase superfamily enzyme